MTFNPTFQNVKSARNKRVEMRHVNSVMQKFDFNQVSCNLPDVVRGRDYGDTLPTEMFHQPFEQFFHFCVGTFNVVGYN